MNDKREILLIHDQWIGLETSGEGEMVLGLCSQDVVWLVPGLGILQGVENVRSFLSTQPSTAIARIDTSNVSVEISGELAVKRAEFCTTFINSGTEFSVSGAHIWTLRKIRQTGRWQVSSVAWVIDRENS